MTTDQDQTQSGPLSGFVIGEPCAFAVECELQGRDPKVPGSGCTAVIRCACGQAFRIDFTGEAGPHGCPQCARAYTSLLVIAPLADDGVLQDVLEHLAEVNGVPMGDGDGEDEDDGEEEEDDGEEEDDNPAPEPGGA